MKKNQESTTFFITTCFFILLLVILPSAGCISLSKSADSEPSTINTPAEGATVAKIAASDTTDSSAETKSTVEPTEPIRVESNEKILLVNPPEQERNISRSFGTLFQEKKSITVSTYAYRVYAAVPPLVIRFNVTPEDRDPKQSYFVVTVRDGNTGDVLVKDGYGLIYSGNTEQSITIYRAGTYHLNIEARRVDVELEILTGDAPLIPEGDASTELNSDEIEFWEYF